APFLIFNLPFISADGLGSTIEPATIVTWNSLASDEKTSSYILAMDLAFIEKSACLILSSVLDDKRYLMNVKMLEFTTFEIARFRESAWYKDAFSLANT